MNFKLFLISGFVLCFSSLKAQNVQFCFQTGYGFYDMSSAKVITTKSFEQLPFDAKIISNYPTYHYYQPMIKFIGKRTDFGFVYLFQTTGSRISAKDYSGEYRFDSKINCHSPGLIINQVINDYGIIKMGLYMQIGANFSAMKLNEYLQIDTISRSNDYKLSASSFYFEPGLHLVYPKDSWGIELNVGYYKEFLRTDYTGENNSIIPIKKSFNESDMWDGLRIGLTFTYTIPERDTSNKD